MNTKINYLYRDGSNYKQPNECVIRGEITPEQIERVMGSLEGGEYFVPEKVGLPEIRFEKINEDDHIWFELSAGGFSKTEEAPDIDMTVEELVDTFCEQAGRWEEGVDLSRFIVEELEEEEELESVEANSIGEEAPEKKPYRVRIEETYVKEVVVWAEDEIAAQELTEELCNVDEIEIDYDNFIKRDTECLGEARSTDMDIFEVYGAGAPVGKEELEAKIQNAVKKQEEGSKEKETLISREPVLPKQKGTEKGLDFQL